MTGFYNERTGNGYEIQFYNRDGNNSKVVGCEDLEDIAKVLIQVCNGNAKGNFPTIWKDGILIR